MCRGKSNVVSENFLGAIGTTEAQCGRSGPGSGKSMHRGSEARERMARKTKRNITSVKKVAKIYSKGPDNAVS